MTHIIVKDSTGKQISEFVGNTNESLGEQLKKNNTPVSIACGMGACGVCTVQISSGRECINEEAFGQKLIPTSRDTILSCIAGIKLDAPETATIEVMLP